MRTEEKSKKNKFYKTNPRGISLIVLVITIIVIIILAAAVILTLNNNNPITEANKARYESDVANMQAIFTNTVAKVMAQNQGTIEVNAGELNSIKTGGNSAEGKVNYTVNNPLDSSNENGVIIFNTGTNNATTYYTGRMLPIYSAGETIWYVDSEGVISLKVGEEEYGKGDKVNNPAEEIVEETEITITDSDNPMMKYIKFSIFDTIKILPSGKDSGTITKIKFITADKVSKDKPRLMDISQAQDKSVMAWLEDNKKTLVIAGKEKIIANSDSSSMFEEFYSLTEIENLRLLDTSQVTNMSSMFNNCNSLASIDLSNFDTSQVTNMFYMFNYCTNLVDLNFGNNFYTSSVIYMKGMFRRCGLTEINLSNFDTSQVTDMSYMFEGSGIKNLDLNNFDTSNVTDMTSMFNEAYKIVNIILGEKFDIKKVTSMNCMFKDCISLKSLGDNINLNITNLADVRGMFKDCKNLTITITIKNRYI